MESSGMILRGAMDNLMDRSPRRRFFRGIRRPGGPARSLQDLGRGLVTAHQGKPRKPFSAASDRRCGWAFPCQSIVRGRSMPLATKSINSVDLITLTGRLDAA